MRDLARAARLLHCSAFSILSRPDRDTWIAYAPAAARAAEYLGCTGVELLERPDRDVWLAWAWTAATAEIEAVDAAKPKRSSTPTD